MICECPAAAAIPTIPVANCVESFGQIQKVAFQRLVKENGTKNALIAQQSQRRILRRLLRGLALFRLKIVQRLLFRPIFRHRRQKVARLVLMAVAMTR